MPELELTPRGVLILVVGPSGVGKDTLIDAARRSLAGAGAFVFPRRVITRATGTGGDGAGGEDHLAATEAVFADMEATGGFLLSWRAHGLAYGVPAEAGEDLAQGRHVVVNVSRSVIPEARMRLQPMRVISVSAPERELRERIARRGRETGAQIDDRVSRAAAFALSGEDVIEVANDGMLEAGVARFLAALNAAAAAHSACG
jgi:ribose 1,5-bisphosphokinase